MVEREPDLTLSSKQEKVQSGVISKICYFFPFFCRRLTSKMSPYKLTYFNGKGRGEVARLLFVKNGVEFEDVRIKLMTDEFDALKAKTSEYYSFFSQNVRDL